MPVVQPLEGMEEEVVQRHPLKEDTKLTVNDFELLKTIGKGSYGTVFEVSLLFVFHSRSV